MEVKIVSEIAENGDTDVTITIDEPKNHTMLEVLIALEVANKSLFEDFNDFCRDKGITSEDDIRKVYDKVRLSDLYGD